MRTPVGPDNVLRLGDSLVVQAAREMPEWKANRYRKVVILFEDRAYSIAKAEPLQDGQFVYRLEPHEESLHELPASTIRYDALYVEEREAKSKLTDQRQGQAQILRLFSPFLGFLFGPTKLRLQERYGLHPITLTWISFYLEAAILLAGIPVFFLDLSNFPIFVLILLDLMFRFDRLLAGGMEQWGFLEWLVRRKGRK